MPEKEWIIDVSPSGDRIAIRFVTRHGRVVDYAIRYEAMIEGAWKQIVLCDGSHGHGQCHNLDWSGRKISRVWAGGQLTLGEAFTAQISDLKTNWERYREGFLRRRP